MLNKEEVEKQFVKEFNYAYEDEDHMRIEKLDDIVPKVRINRAYDRINQKIMIALKSGYDVNWLQHDFFRIEFIFNRLGLVALDDEIVTFAHDRINSIDQALKMLKSVEKIYIAMINQYNSHFDEYVLTDDDNYKFIKQVSEKDSGSLLVNSFEILLKDLHKAFIGIENNQMVGNPYTVIPTDCTLEYGALIVRNSDLATISIKKPGSRIDNLDKKFEDTDHYLAEQIANK